MSALSLVRCDEAPTRIVLVLEVEPTLASRMEAVDVSLVRENAAPPTDAGHFPLVGDRHVSLVSPDRDGLLVLVPRDLADPRRLFVTVVGSIQGGATIRQTALTRFVRGQTLYLHIALAPSCVAVQCREGSTCLDGTCGPIVERALSSSPPRSAAIDDVTAVAPEDRTDADRTAEDRGDLDTAIDAADLPPVPDDAPEEPAAAEDRLDAMPSDGRDDVPEAPDSPTTDAAGDGLADALDGADGGGDDVPFDASDAQLVDAAPDAGAPPDVRDAPSCEESPCACLPPLADCDGVAANGCEVDLLRDPAHCGVCGRRCAAAPNAAGACDAGVCGFVCNGGFTDCNGFAGDGCEQPTATSTRHCGACNNLCPDRPNATTVCRAGACGYECVRGFADCDGAATNGCETDLSARTSCTACGRACPPGDDCVGGVCHSILQLEASWETLCARLDDGTVRCLQPFRMPPSDPGFRDVAEVSVGRFFVCARLNDGTIRCAGSNEEGALGTDDPDAGASPVQVMGVTNAVGLSSGPRHSCARLSTGEVRCWGNNDRSAIVLSGATFYRRPQTVAWLANAVEVEASDVSCGRMADATVRCQGDSVHGALGSGPINTGVRATVVENLRNAAQLEGGENHVCSLLETGEVACWGYNWYGCVGNNVQGIVGETVPAMARGLMNVVQIAAGVHHTCALLRDGTVRSWGINVPGALGDGALLADGGMPTVNAVPVRVSGVANVVEVAAGGYFQCARLREGPVVCWGSGRTAPERVGF